MVKLIDATATRHHALFGPTYIRQHMITDKRWQNADLTDQYSKMTQLLKKREIYKDLEKRTTGRNLRRQHKSLRQQVQDGRVTLQKSLATDRQQTVRSILINHKDMQRLYVNMPLQQIEENINQRTFVMRKEHDRLSCQLDKLKRELEHKIRESSRLETRIRFENEFVLQEELTLGHLHKELANSQTRLKVIQSISATYKKLIQILRNDEKFFEPILESLTKDLEDQQHFIAYVLHVGSPALQRFQELKHDSRKLEDTKRKQKLSKVHWFSELKRGSWQGKRYPNMKSNNPVINIRKHYARETRSMTRLKNILLYAEEEIKQLQEATLSFKPGNIYSIFQKQNYQNTKLNKQVTVNLMQNNLLKERRTNLHYQMQFLKDDFCNRSRFHEEYIKYLKHRINEEDNKEKQILHYIQQKANVSVVLRCSLWNFSDILRHVHVKRQPKVKPISYPKTYMKLPLLKYEHLEMRAAPPLAFEEDTEQLLSIIKEKLKKLVAAHDKIMKTHKATPKDIIASNKEKYCNQYLESRSKSEDFTTELNMMATSNELDSNFDSPKDDVTLPTRVYLKDLSSRIVELALAKD